MERIPKKIIINTTGGQETTISDLILTTAEIENVEKGKKFFDDSGILQEGEAVFSGGEVIPPRLQDKTIAAAIEKNGPQKFKPDEGYDGLSSLTIDIQVPTDTKNIQPKKTVNITKRGEGQSFKPDAGFDGLAELVANVNIPEDKKVGEKTWEVTENGPYTVYPNDGYDGISKLLASVNVPQQIINGQGGEYNIRVTVKEDDTQQLDITDADGGNGKVCVLQEKSIVVEHNDNFEVTADIGEIIEWDKDLTVPTMDNPFDATQKFYYVWDKYYDFAKLLDYSITFNGGQVLTGEPIMLKDKEDKVFGYNLSDNIYVFQKGNWEKDVDGDTYTYVVPENGIYFCYLETHSYGYITMLNLPNATDFDGLSKVNISVDIPRDGKPIEILNQTQMNELISTDSTNSRIGAIYLYQGEASDTYENGALYLLEEVSE